MKTAWIRLAQRLNALSLRERVIMAASLAAALAAVVDVLVLSPQFSTQRALLGSMQVQATELAALRAQLVVPAANTPLAAVKRRLAEQQVRLTALDAAITERLGTGSAASLPELLQRVLRRHERLTLLKLETAPAAAGQTSVRRSVDLRLAGRYADLATFASETEQQLPGLRWATLQLDAGPQPPVLSARVWLPGESQ
jgi:MSHA biogenesis protein MshJ